MNSISSIGLCILVFIAIGMYLYTEILNKKYNVDKPNVIRGVFIFIMLIVALTYFFRERHSNQLFLEKYEKCQSAWMVSDHSSDNANTLAEIKGIDNRIKEERNKNFFYKCKKVASLDYLIGEPEESEATEESLIDSMLNKMKEFMR